MCGIGGVYRGGPLSPASGEILAAMAHSLSHRGPDGRGSWIDAGAGIGLCHTRLAVLDLSPRGAQPMSDHQGRGRISYNGEVYNYIELRGELEGTGCVFSSDTDTEVVLNACLTWGVPRALSRFIGMFAFALWVPGEAALYLVRDRMGIKPLYYGRAGQDLVFGSELKALRAHPEFSPALDTRALELYHMLQYVPSPGTIYADARKLPPGHYLRIDGRGEELVPWWDPDAEVEPHEMSGVPASGLPDLLDDSVRSRLVSDVPLGAFLSGGMDSGIVVASMCRAGGDRPRTFTVSYREEDYDEGPAARRVAQHLGTEHHQVDVDSASLLDTVLDHPAVFDEPLSDPSALPMMVLSRAARRRVTVVLSGDGGDELFGGYDRYRAVDTYMGGAGKLPHALRKAGAGVLSAIPPAMARSLYGMGRKTGAGSPVANFAGKWEKFIKLLRQMDAANAYLAAVGIFSAFEAGELFGRGRPVGLPETFQRALGAGGGADLVRRMMHLDAQTFLPDDVLTKVDRASMAEGLEVRVPLLDHRIVRLSRRFPVTELLRDGRGKTPLREMARADLPRQVLRDPKMGFSMPLDSWLRGELKDLLLAHLGPGSRVLQGYFDPGYVGRMVREHLAGRRNHHEKLWNLLVFSLWEERWKPAA